MPRGPWHEEVDLIVVGASASGLTAALLAADRGCRVIMIERAKELGGGALTESEVICAAGTRLQRVAGIEDTPAGLAADILAATRHHVEPELVTALAEQGAPLVAWLADRCGARMSLLPASAQSGHRVARLHSPGDLGGASLVAELARAVTRHSHVAIRLGTVGERLVRDEAGMVRAVTVRSERRGAGQTLAGVVLLASGGFAGSDELVAVHCPAAAALPYHGSARAVGDGLRLGTEVGAQARRLGSCAVTPFLAMPSQLAVTTPLVSWGAILVNQAGRRFIDETGESLAVATTVRAQPGHLAYLIFDERIARRAADPFFARVVLPRAGRHAATLPDLAKQFELNVEALGLTVDTFNGNLELGGDPFGREGSTAPLTPPFHAIRVTGARRLTLGGLAVDAAARVLDADGHPIPGLYASGGVAAGLGGEGTEGTLAGTDTLAALGLARLAALEVITTAASKSPEPT